jgi:hypothetical protein
MLNLAFDKKLNIPFAKNFFGKKFHVLKFNVCMQIKALFIKFQKKNLTHKDYLNFFKKLTI